MAYYKIAIPTMEFIGGFKQYTFNMTGSYTDLNLVKAILRSMYGVTIGTPAQPVVVGGSRPDKLDEHLKLFNQGALSVVIYAEDLLNGVDLNVEAAEEVLLHDQHPAAWTGMKKETTQGTGVKGLNGELIEIDGKIVPHPPQPYPTDPKVLKRHRFARWLVERGLLTDWPGGKPEDSIQSA